MGWDHHTQSTLFYSCFLAKECTSLRVDLIFTINFSYAGSVCTFTLKGVGEIQSPLWRRNSETKTAAMSQSGIYTVGQFTKGASGALLAVVVHKDKTAQIAVARLNGDERNADNSLGTFTFKLVGEMDPIDLKDSREFNVCFFFWNVEEHNDQQPK